MLKAGQILKGTYSITRVIGKGGMGAVYEARHIELNSVCVVKEMLPPDDDDLVELLAKQFKREAMILASLKHPNLPRVTDYFTEGDKYYLVMDLIEGTSLDKLISVKGLSEAKVLKYADQLLVVLDYVHGKGVLHRDIKPANIIVQPDDNVILVDFGLVKIVGSQMSSFSMRGLTPHYAPPEQYKGGTDAHSDLYSLAATLYQALSGVLPTSASDQFSGDALQPLGRLRPDISQNTVRVIEKTLQLDRAKRCQNAAEMRAALKDPGTAVVDEPKVGPAVGDSMLTSPLAPEPPVVDNPTHYQDGQLPPPKPKPAPPQKVPMPVWQQAAIGGMALVIVVLLAVVIAPALTPPPLAPTALPTPAVPVALTNDQLLTLAPNVTLDLARIPAGEFLMGSTDADSQAGSYEKPQHKVTLDEYLIGKTEVTNAQYAAYAQARGLNWSMPSGEENHPVVNVSWGDAVAFCAWATQTTGRNVTLPTEAQWEKAARGTDGRIYPWGNEAPNANLANFNSNEKGTTAVGKYSSAGDSPYGLVDTAGNVWEWTADWYRETYYASSPASNPQGPTTGQYRVVRGGGWSSYSSYVRAAYRDGVGPAFRYDNCGFRVAVSAPGS